MATFELDGLGGGSMENVTGIPDWHRMTKDPK
jgi:hypothetical protein